jgi:hypothetical protein
MRSRAVGGAQDAAETSEAQDSHLGGVPATGGFGKFLQLIHRRDDRPGGTNFTWLHMGLPTTVAKTICTESRGPIIPICVSQQGSSEEPPAAPLDLGPGDYPASDFRYVCGALEPGTTVVMAVEHV